MFKSELKEIHPHKVILVEGDYNKLIYTATIDGKNLRSIWDDFEIILQMHRIKRVSNRYIGPNKELDEIQITFYKAQQKLISEGKKPYVKFKLPLRYRYPKFFGKKID